MQDLSKKRILFLNSLQIYGGGEFFVYQAAKILKNRNYRVTISCLKNTELYNKCRLEGIEQFPVDYPVNSTKGVFKIAKILTDYIKLNGIDIVHSNTNFDRTAGAVAAKISGIKHVTNIHSLQSIQHNITHYIRNRMLTHQFIADGEKIRDMLIKKDNIDISKISILYLGIENDNGNDVVTRKKIRNEFSVPDEKILVGNTARMVDFKGQEFLIRAFAVAAEENNNVMLMLVGDGELMGYLQKISAELGIKDKIIFTGFRKDMYEMYSAFDIYAHTSVEGGGEAFPFALIHALQKKLPMVVTDVGSMSLMVKDGVNGFVLPEKDTLKISEAVKKLSQSSDLRNIMGQKSYELYNSKFTAEKMTDKVEEIYNKILAKKNN